VGAMDVVGGLIATTTMMVQDGSLYLYATLAACYMLLRHAHASTILLPATYIADRFILTLPSIFSVLSSHSHLSTSTSWTVSYWN